MLKWFHNNQPVYQWIPERQPFGLKHFKNRVNTTYAVSDHVLHKHRAMAVTKPMWNFTGEYSCSVHTFESNDRQTAKVVVIGEQGFVVTSSILLQLLGSHQAHTQFTKLVLAGFIIIVLKM